jgi:hypothetical protein
MATMAARCGPKNDCPLQVRRIFLSGRAPQVIVKNQAKYPIGHIVFHTAYEDLFSKYNELTLDVDTIVQPGERVTLGLKPITTSIEWETVEVYATCERVEVDRPSEAAPAP